jgi:hypothetical protein
MPLWSVYYVVCGDFCIPKYVVIWHFGSSERFSDFVPRDSYILGVIDHIDNVDNVFN